MSGGDAKAAPGGEIDNSRWGVFAALIFVTALAVRVAVIADFGDLPTQHSLVEDAEAYDETARKLLANDWLPERAFYQAPLYPYFLAVCYRWLGPSLVGVRLVQALLGAATAWLLGACGRQLGGANAGLLTGFLAALYAPFLFFVPLLLKPTLVIFLESLFIFLVLRTGEKRSPFRVAAIGVTLGLAMMVRGNLVLLIPFFVAWWVFERVRRQRRLTGELTLLAGGFLLAVLPISWVNYKVSGDLILTSSQSGPNFYIGNRAGATGLYQPLRPGRETPELEQEDARRVAAEIVSRETGTEVDGTSFRPTEVSRAFWRESRREIAAAPGTWLRLLGKKLLLFWNAYEIPDTENHYVYRDESVWLRWNPTVWSVVAPLGLLGLAVRFRTSDGSFFAWMVLASMISVTLFFLFGRYRLPVVPFLLPPASLAVFWLAGSLQGRRFRKLGVAVAALVVLTAVVRIPLVSPGYQRVQVAVSHFNLGVAASRMLKKSLDGDLEEATRWAALTSTHLGLARENDPSFVPAWVETAVLELRRGNLVHRQGLLDEARARYAEAERLLDASTRMPKSREFADIVTKAREELSATIWRNRVLAAMDVARRQRAAGDDSGARAALADAEAQMEKLLARDREAGSDLLAKLESLRGD